MPPWPRPPPPPASSRRSPSSTSASVRLSGGSSRTTLSAAGPTQHPRVVAGAHHVGVRRPALQAEHQPLAAHRLEHLRMRGDEPLEPLAEPPGGAADLVEEARRGDDVHHRAPTAQASGLPP